MAAGDVTLNNNKITNLATPTQNGDAVNLGYLSGFYTSSTTLD
jgi:hypothetical protein